MPVLDKFAKFNVVNCDWCDNYINCRSMFDSSGEWVMSICEGCEQMSRLTDNERDARYDKWGSDFEPSNPCKACRWTTCQCGKMGD